MLLNYMEPFLLLQTYSLTDADLGFSNV